MKKLTATVFIALLALILGFGISRVISLQFTQTLTADAPPYDDYLHQVVINESDPEVIRQLIHERPDFLKQEREGYGSALITAVGLQKYEAATVLVAERWDPFLESSPITILAGRCAVELAIGDDDLRMLNILIGAETYGKLSRPERQALTQWRDRDMAPEMRNYIDSRLED